jgi:hypothetical protein
MAGIDLDGVGTMALELCPFPLSRKAK